MSVLEYLSHVRMYVTTQKEASFVPVKLDTE